MPIFKGEYYNYTRLFTIHMYTNEHININGDICAGVPIIILMEKF